MIRCVQYPCVAEGWERVHKATSRLRDGCSLRAAALQLAPSFLRFLGPPGSTSSAQEPQRQRLHQQTEKQGCNEIRHDVHASVARCSCERCVMREPRSMPLTTIAKPMNRFAACGDPWAERGLRTER